MLVLIFVMNVRLAPKASDFRQRRRQLPLSANRVLTQPQQVASCSAAVQFWLIKDHDPRMQWCCGETAGLARPLSDLKATTSCSIKPQHHNTAGRQTASRVTSWVPRVTSDGESSRAINFSSQGPSARFSPPRSNDAKPSQRTKSPYRPRRRSAA